MSTVQFWLPVQNELKFVVNKSEFKYCVVHSLVLAGAALELARPQ